MAGNPYSKFFWADWQADPALKVCSLAAQGLWMRMLCVMAEAEPRGHLLIGTKPCTMRDLAAIAGADEATVIALVGELDARGVFSRVGHAKTIASRRMIRDDKLSRTRARSAGIKWEKERGKKGENVNGANELPGSHMQSGVQTSMQSGSKRPDPRENNALPDLHVPCDGAAQRVDGRTQSEILENRTPAFPNEDNGVPRLHMQTLVQPVPVPESSTQPCTTGPEPTEAERREAHRRLMQTMPRRNDAPHRWAGLAESWAINNDAKQVPMVGNYELVFAVEAVCVAAGYITPDLRLNWMPLVGWLKDRIDLHDTILPTIRNVARRSGYAPPASLAYFDRAVRTAAAVRKSA
jgi:hypothetical protein